VGCLLEDGLVGGAAFRVDRLGTRPAGIDVVRFVGQGVLEPDHLDVVAEPGSHPEVSERVAGWLRRPGSRVIDLDGLPAGSVLASRLGGSVVERHVAPYAILPSEPADYLRSRPGRLRSTLTRARKRFARDGVVVRRVLPEDADAGLDRLSRLHEARWAEQSEFAGAWTGLRRAASEGIRRGDVVLLELVTADGTTIASELDMLAGGRMAFYQAGRLTDHEYRGSGSVLKIACIELGIEAGCTEYDLLRGDEPYKSDWADERRDLVRLMAGVGVGGRVVAGGTVGIIRASERAIEFRRRNEVDEVDHPRSEGDVVTEDTERIVREREFHDQRFAAEEPRPADRFYAINGRSAEQYRAAIDRLGTDAAVLEIGCGETNDSWRLDDQGLTVTAIDISPVAVEQATARSTAEGRDRITFLEMDAHRLAFEDSSFDGVIGSGILHHLDLELAIPEIARVLRPHGCGVFLDPLGMNPALRAYRRLTPSQRTEDEHPLVRDDFQLLRSWFEDVELTFFSLASLAATPLIGRRSFDRTLAVLDRIDERVLRSFEPAQNMAWFVLMELRGPKVLKS
jgi:SAM-dependent methyltransferase